MVKYDKIRKNTPPPPHLELNIVLNIQSPGYYADSLNVKRQHYKLSVEIPFFTLFLYIHFFWVYILGINGRGTPPHLG